MYILRQTYNSEINNKVQSSSSALNNTPSAPVGYIFLVDDDGSYLIADDGAYLTGEV